MDPITGLPPVQPPVAPEPTAGAAAPAATQGAATEGAASDAQIAEYEAVAAGFVSQMYMTIWREAQRNGSAGA